MSTSSNDSERINTANPPSTPSSSNIQPPPPLPNARDEAAPAGHSEEVLVDCRSPPTSSPPISNEDNNDGDQPNYSPHFNGHHHQHAIITSFASNDGDGSSGSPLNTPGGSIVDPMFGSSSPRGYFPSSLPLPISTNDINNTVPRSTVFAHVPSMYHSTQATPKQQLALTPHHCPPTTTPTRQRCHAQVHHPSSFSTTTSAATSVKEIIVREPPLVDHQLQDPLPFTYYFDEASTHPLNYNNNDNYCGRPSYAIRFLDRDSGSITTTTPSVVVGSSRASGSLTNPDDINDDYDDIFNTRSSPSSSPESPPSELIPLVGSLRHLNHRSTWAPPPSSNAVASNFHPQPFL